MDDLDNIRTIDLDIEEIKQLAFDFTNEVGNAAYTLVSPVITCTADIGIDPSAQSVVVGGGTISGKQVLVRVQGRSIPEVTYHVRCVVMDSNGDKHTLAVNLFVTRR